MFLPCSMKNVTYYEPFPPPPWAILNTGKQPEIKREAVLSCLNSVNLEQQPLLPSFFIILEMENWDLHSWTTACKAWGTQLITALILWPLLTRQSLEKAIHRYGAKLVFKRSRTKVSVWLKKSVLLKQKVLLYTQILRAWLLVIATVLDHSQKKTNN